MSTSFSGDRRPLPQGTVLLNYTVGPCIGEGGTSLVYSARDRVTGEFVVIKEYYPVRRSVRAKSSYESPFERNGLRLLPKPGTSARYLKGAQQFLREQEISDALRFERGSNYSGILPQRSLPLPEDPAFQGTAAAYAVMKTAAGEPLSDYIQRERENKNFLPGLIGILCGVLSRLSRFHTRGYLHLDITPRNIYLLTVEGTYLPVFLDYGSAQKLGEIKIDALTCSSGFSAPELRLDEPEKLISAATDLFSVGAVFYYALTGKPFYIEETESDENESDEAWFLHRMDENEGTRALPEGVRLTLAKLLSKALSEEPAGRYADCAAMMKALEELRDVISGRGFHPAVLYHFSLNALKARQEKNPIDADILPEVRRTDADGTTLICHDLLEAVTSANKANCMLVSAGGTGKTTGMIYAADKIAESYPRSGNLAVYIPAIEVVADRTGNCILKYIFNHLIGWTGSGSEDYENRLYHLIRTGFAKTGKTLTVFVDGVNESSSAERILADIEALHRLFPDAVRFAVSSRSAAEIGLSDPCLLTMLPIRKHRVLAYLRDSVKYTAVQSDETLLQLLTNPLYLTMYKRTGYVLRYKKYPNWQILTDDREEITSVGQLLWNYNQSLIIRSIGRQVTDPPCDTPNSETYFASVAVHRYLLPAVCFRMFISGGNAVNYRQFRAIYEEADSEIREEKPSVGDDLPRSTPITWLRRFSEEEGTLIYSTNAADDICDIHAAHETLFSFYVALYLYNHCLAGSDPEKRKELFSAHRYPPEILSLFDGISRQETFALAETEKRALLALQRDDIHKQQPDEWQQSAWEPLTLRQPSSQQRQITNDETLPGWAAPSVTPPREPQTVPQTLPAQNIPQTLPAQNIQQTPPAQNKQPRPAAKAKQPASPARSKTKPRATPAAKQGMSKKKLMRFGYILLLISAVFMLIGGILLIVTVTGENKETKNTSGSAGSTAAVSEQSGTAVSAPTENNIAGTVSTTAVSPGRTVTEHGSTAAEDTGTAAASEPSASATAAVPRTTDEIIAFYANAVNDIKNNGSASYNKREYQTVDNFNITGNSIVDGVIGNIAGKYSKTEEKAELQTAVKGQASSGNLMLGWSLTDNSKVTSAVLTQNGDNYDIVIRMADEDTPKKNGNSHLAAVGSVFYPEDVEAVLKSIDVLKNYDDIGVKYSGYTIRATVSPEGKIIDLKHSCTVETRIGHAEISVIGMEPYALENKSISAKNTVHFTNFAY